MVSAKSVKKALLKKPKKHRIKDSDFISTGHTLLNLACTDRIDGGLVKGVYHNLIGDSDTGKSVLAMEMMAQTAEDLKCDDYQLVYYNAEHAQLLDPAQLSKKLARRIEIVYPSSVEEFYYDMEERGKKGKFFALLDSMDALVAEAEEKKFQKRKKAHQKGEDAAG